MTVNVTASNTWSFYSPRSLVCFRNHGEWTVGKGAEDMPTWDGTFIFVIQDTEPDYRIEPFLGADST